VDKEEVEMSIARKAPTKKPPLKACRECGTLNLREASQCSNCGSPNLTDDWEGIVIILKPNSSIVGSKIGVDKPIMRAIKVAGRIV